MFKLPSHLKQMGENTTCGHRSGWPYVMEELRKRATGGILLDDFIERTFQQTPHPPTWNEPWVGIFHHPQNLPKWFEPTAVPKEIFRKPAFFRSKPQLRGAIALSTYLAKWLHKTLGVQSIALLHPSEIPEKQWSPSAWVNGQKYVVQVGWYLRNYRAIYQVRVPAGMQKLHLVQQGSWVQRQMGNTDKNAPTKDRLNVGHTAQCPRVDDATYDRLLSESVVFLELYDTSANNAIVEAIARTTPVVVNRHPATEEYLGKDYPLLYDDISQVHNMLTPDNIISAHRYLKKMDRSWLSAKYFADQVEEFIRRVV